MILTDAYVARPTVGQGWRGEHHRRVQRDPTRVVYALTLTQRPERITEPAGHSSPVSVRQPRAQLGRTAAELLVDEIHGAGCQHRQVVFKPELVVRESS